MYMYIFLLRRAARHETVAYRQGMHEILATILFCLESELNAWGSISSSQHFLGGIFTESSLEAHAYWLFDRYCRLGWRFLSTESKDYISICSELNAKL
jgi:hypothetical protein